MSISAFPYTTPIRFALEIAEKKPDTVTLIGESKIQTNPDTDKTELHADVVVVGAKAHLNQQTLLNANVVCCKTFLSLGTFHCDKLQIHADQIVLCNRVTISKSLDCTANKTGALIQFDLQSVTDPKKTFSLRVKYGNLYPEDPYIYRNGRLESPETSVGTTISVLKQHLDRQDFWDLREATKETRIRAGLRSPLVPEPQTSLPKRPTV